MVNRAFLSLLLSLFLSAAYSQESDSTRKVFSVGGYVKELPYFQLVKNQTTTFDNILTLRLNFAVNLSASTSIVLELRNRLMFGDTDWGDISLVEQLKKDNGWLDLSVASVPGGSRGAVHAMADRFYLEHNAGKWQFRAGRQRINWGINMVSNPNDLFNTYSFFDFDYPERPGSDAVRTQYFINSTSRLDLAIAPAGHIRNAVAALLYTFNYKGYDIQLISGYYHDRLALGGGWAGNIGDAGFKGEATFFNDLNGSGQSDLVASLSTDYIFGNGLYLVLEGLYNGGYEPAIEPVFNLLTPLSADNIMFSRYAITTSVSYPFSPLLSGAFSAMSLPDIHAFFVAPSLTWSVAPNFDVSLTSQIFAGGGDTGIQGAAVALIGSLQWSF